MCLWKPLGCKGVSGNPSEHEGAPVEDLGDDNVLVKTLGCVKECLRSPHRVLGGEVVLVEGFGG